MQDLIDARALADQHTVEELAAKADGLVRSMTDTTALLAKPCSTFREAPDILTCFGMLLGALGAVPGMTVLDFGAGSCWTSHFLTQLGCRVIAMDVSEAMLELGRRRFDQQPPFGERPEPTFSHFDGHTMDLADASVDRIVCFDALHHVPNPAEVLAEMGRVLRPGGVAAFSEPGPRHSQDPQSQHEMRRYGVPELDLVIEDVWRWAHLAGFADLSVGVFSPAPQWVPLQTFEAFLAAAVDPGPRLPSRLRQLVRAASIARGPGSARAMAAQVQHVRGVLQNRRMFVMHKAGQEVPDSREATGLAAELTMTGVTIERHEGTVTVAGTCRARNTGRNRWLPMSAGQGAVLVGLRLGSGDRPADDHGRAPLPGDMVVAPGDTVEVPFRTAVPAVRPGDPPLRLEVDLVAEGIAWFAEISGHPHEIWIDAGT